MNSWIAWFARNHVAANLLMGGIIIAGLLTAPTIKQSVMPDFELNYVSITVVYPGASPEEVEKAVTVRIEEEIQDIDGIEEIRSSANEGATNITVEVELGADLPKILNEIEARVDGITTFPAEIEEPIVSELAFRSNVLDVAVHGPLDEKTLKRLGQQLRDEIVLLPGVTQASLIGARPFEIAIEVSEESLQRHGLRFEDVLLAVQRSSLDMPGGSVRTESGEILLRTDNQAYRGVDFERIPLIRGEDGARVDVGDVAAVIDGFDEREMRTTFDGEPALFIQVERTGDQQALEIARQVHAYLEEARLRLPAGVQLTVWDDESRYLSDRLDMMLRNAWTGFLLVIALLACFLKLRVALWVAVGLPVSICGALALMPWVGVDINVLTVFAFIMALGILVDDAIVTGENVYTHQERDPGDPLGTAIRGTQEVATPVVFGVLTTVAAFAPFMLVEGSASFFAKAIGAVMVIALLFSLIESKLVLPSHLAHASGVGRPARKPISLAWGRFQSRVAGGLRYVIEEIYRPAVTACVEWRYLTAAVSLAIFAITVSMVSSGYVKQQMSPTVEMDTVRMKLKMPLGTPIDETADAVARVRLALDELRAELQSEARPGEPEMMTHVLGMVGAQGTGGPVARPISTGQSHLGQISVALSDSRARSVSAPAIARRWDEKVGSIPGLEELTFSGEFRNFGEPIDIELTGFDVDELEVVAGRLVAEMETYPGLVEIRDTHVDGKQELHIEVLPSAEALGLTVEDVGRQVRQAFYGAEAQRIQRGQDEVKVMIRYPADERRSLADVENMRIRLPDGTAVPFASVASIELERGPASLVRRDRQRTVSVLASIEEGVANAVAIAQDIEDRVMPEILAEHPSVGWSFRGEQRERRRGLTSLRVGFLVALMSIFTLIAIPLRSYLQAIVIMLAIPFGYVGAVIGHLLFDVEISFLSITGVMACAGVVVNDSLVLVTFLNRLREQGMTAFDAAVEAGQRRFRAIMLTSLTTFAGLLPVMLERSSQARMVIPMAIALAFGVMIATFFTLLLIPAAVIIVEDIRLGWSKLVRRVFPAGSPEAELG